MSSAVIAAPTSAAYPGLSANTFAPLVISVTPKTAVHLGELLRALQTAVLQARQTIAVVVIPRCSAAEWESVELILDRGIAFPIEILVSGSSAQLAPGCAWLVQAGSRLTLDDKGRLAASSREDLTGESILAEFLDNLSEKRGHLAMAMIFDFGTLNNKSVLRAFQGAGGVCFWHEEDPQKPNPEFVRFARHFRGSVLELAAHALRIAKGYHHPSIQALFSNRSTGADELYITAIYKALASVGASNLNNYVQAELRPRLAREMVLADVSGLDRYLQLIQNQPVALDNLLSAVSVGTGGWFRDPLIFDALSASVVPLLAAKNSDTEFSKRKIQAWVPGCSTGEEVYQVAIALLEGLKWDPSQDEPPIQIFATDISTLAIEIGCRGVFQKSSMRCLPTKYIEKYFVQHGEEFEVIDAVRRRCSFQQHNLISNAPLSSMDLISCRNVLHLFGPGVLRKVIPMLHYSLKPGGFLLMGSGEKLIAASQIFVPFDQQARIFRKPPVGLVVARSPTQAPMSEANQIGLQSAAERMLLARYSPPTLIFDGAMIIQSAIGNLSPFVKSTASLNGSYLPDVLNGDFLKAVWELFDRVVSQDQDSAGSVHITALDDQTRDARISIEMTSIWSAFSGNSQYFSVSFLSKPTLAPALPCEQAEEIARLQSTNRKLTARIDELKIDELKMMADEAEAINEELSSSNQALVEQLAAQSSVVGDLTSVLAAHHVPTILIDQFECIKRISGSCESVSGLGFVETGATVRRLTLGDLHLQPIVAKVLREGELHEESIQDLQGRWWVLRVAPTRNVLGRREAVLTFVDKDRETQSETEMMEARAITQSVLEASPVPMVILDENLRASMANNAFLSTYQLNWVEVQSRYFPELAASKWQFPDLRLPLTDLIQESTAAQWACDVGRDLAKGYSLALHAYSLHSHDRRRLMVVLEDLSERQETQREHNRLLGDIREKELALKRTVEAFRALSERQINTQEEERRRVARELHDDLGQKVALLHFDVSSLSSDLGLRSPAKREILQRLEERISSLTYDVRNIAHQIHPSILDDLGLAAAIKLLAEEFRQRNGMPVRIRAENFPAFCPHL